MKNSSKKQYIPSEIELKWQAKWEKDKIYQPKLDSAKDGEVSRPPHFAKASRGEPFYNLMMFPYPSAEGLHVGSVYAFGGADVYGRFKRMQGHDVFEPMGLDGFGIHSENHAIKTGTHPIEHAQRTEENFYRQLHSIGNSFAWDNKLETYSPQYYKWTQWLFVQLFKSNLAYRKSSAVNYCPFCKTVLSDEQVIDGKCERCSTVVEKKELEQWFFRITNYADRLLNNIQDLNWTEKVKIAQRNWIGKSEGANIEFPLVDPDIDHFVLLHGKGGSSTSDFLPWIKSQLENRGYTVEVPDLPNASEPDDEEQMEYVRQHCRIDKKTSVVAHSFGGIVALRLLEQGVKMGRVTLVSTPYSDNFLDGRERPSVSRALAKGFNFDIIKMNCGGFVAVYDTNDHVVPVKDGEAFAAKLDCMLVRVKGQKSHFNGAEEPEVLRYSAPAVRVFTTRPDTIYGATYLVLAPEHPWVLLAVDPRHQVLENKEEVRLYVQEARQKSDVERSAEGKEKTGVELKGVKAINPVTKKEIPVWVADYVLGGYGTGAIMAVPAHDVRDYEFARKFDLQIKEVIVPEEKYKVSSIKYQGKENEKILNTEYSIPDTAYTGAGILANSGEWEGWKTPGDIGKTITWLEEKGVGKREVNYHLRDWLISRQRYWGPPIPMIFCQACSDRGDSWFTTEEARQYEESGIRNQESGQREKDHNSLFMIHNSQEMAGWYPVPEDQLPVDLPYIEDFKPLGTGKSPLATDLNFVKVQCPHCGADARRETDVSDTFLDSAWYFLRYLSVDRDDVPFDKEIVKKWLPVHMYIGGAEHSVLHLLYARFITMALHDMGQLPFEEPFKRFYAHGLIIKDGAKMSKSKGNVINPDEYIEKYGADSLRCYLMFLGPFNQGGDFSDSGIEGMNRFLKRVWFLFQEAEEGEIGDEGLRMMHKTIKKVTEELENLRYNTAIASLMEYYNFLYKQEKATKSEAEVYLKLLAPFAPYMTEELWMESGIRNQESGQGEKDHDSLFMLHNSIHLSEWPGYDEKYLQEGSFTIAVQVNGKLRGTVQVSSADAINKELVEAMARKDDNVAKFLQTEVKQVIYVPGKILNFVVI